MTKMLGLGEYEAFATDNRNGDAVVAELTPWIVRGQWNRYVDDIAPAEVTIAATPGCCELLCDIQPLRHDLMLVRNGDVVWHGPIVRIQHSVKSMTARLEARDVMFWLTRRVVHNDLSFEGDLSEYARKVIVDAMSPDDRGVIEHITILPGAVSGTRNQNALTVNSYEEIRELARTVIDYTTVGKRIIIAPDLFVLGTVANLTDDDFLDGIEVVRDGLDYINVSHVRGRNFVKTVGSPSPYYGLVEDILREFSIEDEESALAAGDIQVQTRDYPPTLVFGNGGATLSPTAPIKVSDLVPGTIVNVNLDEPCPPVHQQMRLLRVEVNFAYADGEAPESVGVRAGPLGFTSNRRRDL